MSLQKGKFISLGRGRSMVPSKTALGKFLRFKRLGLGLRQTKVAKLSNMTQVGYSNFETGLSKYLKPKNIKKLARVFKCQEVEISNLVPLKFRVKPKTKLGKFIRKRRKELGLSVDDFAKRLKVSVKEARSIEIHKKRTKVNFRWLSPLSLALQIEPAELVKFGSSKKSRKSEFGNLIRLKRLELGFSLKVAALKLQVSAENVRLMENGKISFSTGDEKITKLAKILKIDLERLKALRPERKMRAAITDPETFAGLLTNRRLELHMSRKHLSENSGVSRNMIFFLETGKRHPSSQEMLDKICYVLKYQIPPSLITIKQVKPGRPKGSLKKNLPED